MKIGNDTFSEDDISTLVDILADVISRTEFQQDERSKITYAAAYKLQTAIWNKSGQAQEMKGPSMVDKLLGKG